MHRRPRPLPTDGDATGRGIGKELPRGVVQGAPPGVGTIVGEGEDAAPRAGRAVANATDLEVVAAAEVEVFDGDFEAGHVDLRPGVRAAGEPVAQPVTVADAGSRTPGNERGVGGEVVLGVHETGGTAVATRGHLDAVVLHLAGAGDGTGPAPETEELLGHAQARQERIGVGRDGQPDGQNVTGRAGHLAHQFGAGKETVVVPVGVEAHHLLGRGRSGAGRDAYRVNTTGNELGFRDLPVFVVGQQTPARPVIPQARQVDALDPVLRIVVAVGGAVIEFQAGAAAPATDGHPLTEARSGRIAVRKELKFVVGAGREAAGDTKGRLNGRARLPGRIPHGSVANLVEAGGELVRPIEEEAGAVGGQDRPVVRDPAAAVGEGGKDLGTNGGVAAATGELEFVAGADGQAGDRLGRGDVRQFRPVRRTGYAVPERDGAEAGNGVPGDGQGRGVARGRLGAEGRRDEAVRAAAHQFVHRGPYVQHSTGRRPPVEGRRGTGGGEEDFADQQRRRGGVHRKQFGETATRSGEEQGRRAGHVGRRRARSPEAAVAVPEGSGEDVRTVSGQINGGGAEAGAAGKIAIGLQLRYADEVIAGAIRGEVAQDIDVPQRVRNRPEVDDAQRPERVVEAAPDGAVLDAAELAAPAGVGRHDVGPAGPARPVVLPAGVDDVAVGLNDLRFAVQKAVPDGQQFDVPVDAGDAEVVVPPRPDNARHRRTVGVGGPRAGVPVVAVGVVAEVVVDVAVVIVVQVVPGDLVVVAPEVGQEVFVVQVGPVVQHGDYDGITIGGNAAGGDVPGRLDVDVLAGDAVGQLPDVI